MLRNRMDAEDITQEVMIRLWKNINNFNFNSAKSWIMRTTHNLCIDHIRKIKNISMKEIVIEERHFEFPDEESNEENPFIYTSKNFTEEKIKSAIENLPERYKSPFLLFEIEGFRYNEISKILDMPLSSVKINLLRARKLLQKELKEYASEEIRKS